MRAPEAVVVGRRSSVGPPVAACVALVVFLAGCVTPPAARPVAAPSAMPVLRLATSGDYAPFSIAGANGELSGFDVEVAARLARDLGWRVEIVRFAWPELNARLEAGDFDVAMSGVTMRPERALIGGFTRPYAVVGATVLIRESDARRFPSVAALDRPGVRLAVNAGGHLERVARQRFPRARVEPVADNRALPQRVRDGRADAAVTDTAEARAWQQPGLLMLGPFRRDHKAALLPASAADLAARVDEWLAAREADGWLDAERVRWLGAEASLDAAAAGREAVAAWIRLRLDLMPAVAAAKHAAGLPIEDPAQEARVIERVRALATVDPERVERVYRQLITLAKAVQRAAPPEPPRATLDALRDAIARIDTHLVRELDRQPVGAIAEWRATLGRSLSERGIDTGAIDDLARTLAADSNRNRSGRIPLPPGKARRGG